MAESKVESKNDDVKNEENSDSESLKLPIEPVIEEQIDTTFEKLGVVKELCDACEQVNWKKPSHIQVKALPVALEGTIFTKLMESTNLNTFLF